MQKMGFDKLYREMCGVQDKSEPLRKLLAMPALMATLRNNYDAAGLYKPFIKTRLRTIAKRVGTVRDGDESLRRTMDELTERLVLYQDAADPDVQRWARISAELRADPTVLAFLSDACDAKLAQMLRPTFSWMVSECNRRGCPVRALS